MARRSSPEQLAHLRQSARCLVERTADHQAHLVELLASAERDLRAAECDVTHATTAGVDQARRLLGVVQQKAAGAATARQLQIDGRQQHAAACRLLAELNCDDRSTDTQPNSNIVLVVDDYGDVRAAVAGVLQEAGFVVRTAANGLEGLIAAYEARPGVIVMDVAMPVLDGIEATRLIKANAATRDARVIAYTANPSLDGTAVRNLFAAVLQKPATPDAVLAAVQQVAGL